MEWIRGRPLIEAADALRLDLRGRVELLARIARAVHYAHEHGVIHRDLKPGNILVDESGAPKVLDFGIARVQREPGSSDDGTATRCGEVLGTPAYMSPEQLGGFAHLADARADIYALGLIAYELLSGRRARPTPPQGANLLEEFRRCEPAPLGSVDPRLRDELEAVVMHALEREPERRYATALEFAEDCDRHLRDEPVRARHPSKLRKAVLFARRHRVLVSCLAATFAALVTGVLASVRHSRIVEHERNLALEARWNAEREAESAKAMFEIANQNKDSLQATHDFLKGMLESVGVNKLGADVRVTDVLANASAKLLGTYPDAPEVELDLQYTLAKSYYQLGLFLESEAHYRRARDLMIETRGERDADVVRATIGLAQVMLASQRIEDAAPLIERAVELAALPEVSCDYDARRSVREFAVLMVERGEHRRAEALLERTIESSRADGRVDDVLARLMLVLSDSLWDRQEYDQALAWNQQALEVQRACGSESLSLTLATLGSLAGSLRKVGRVAQALAIYDELLPEMTRVYGPSHKNTVSSWNNYALALGDAGRCGEACEALQRVLAWARETLGETDYTTLGVLNNLADRYSSDGQFERTSALYDEWLRLARAAPAGRTPTMVRVRNNVVVFLGDRGRFAEALEVCDELVALGREVLADDAVTNAYFEGRMGFLLHQLGRDDEAEPLLASCVAVLDQAHGDRVALDSYWRDALAAVRAARLASGPEVTVATK
jgi:tetratricopeptide (TPR) repeat protein